MHHYKQRYLNLMRQKRMRGGDVKTWETGDVTPVGVEQISKQDILSRRGAMFRSEVKEVKSLPRSPSSSDFKAKLAQIQSQLSPSSPAPILSSSPRPKFATSEEKKLPTPRLPPAVRTPAISPARAPAPTVRTPARPAPPPRPIRPANVVLPETKMKMLNSLIPQSKLIFDKFNEIVLSVICCQRDKAMLRIIADKKQKESAKVIHDLHTYFTDSVIDKVAKVYRVSTEDKTDLIDNPLIGRAERGQKYVMFKHPSDITRAISDIKRQLTSDNVVDKLSNFGIELISYIMFAYSSALMHIIDRINSKGIVTNDFKQDRNALMFDNKITKLLGLMPSDCGRNEKPVTCWSKMIEKFKEMKKLLDTMKNSIESTYPTIKTTKLGIPPEIITLYKSLEKGISSLDNTFKKFNDSNDKGQLVYVGGRRKVRFA